MSDVEPEDEIEASEALPPPPIKPPRRRRQTPEPPPFKDRGDARYDVANSGP